MGEEDRGGLPDLDPDLSKNWGGLPNRDLDPTRFLSRHYPPRDILPMVDIGEEDRGGLPNLDPDLSKNRGGLPDLDLDPTRFLSRFYPPRDISPISDAYKWSCQINAHISLQD